MYNDIEDDVGSGKSSLVVESSVDQPKNVVESVLPSIEQVTPAIPSANQAGVKTKRKKV